MEKRITETTILRGTTYTNEALMKTADILLGNTARPNKAKPIVIVFTDGFSGEDPANVYSEYFDHKRIFNAARYRKVTFISDRNMYEFVQIRASFIKANILQKVFLGQASNLGATTNAACSYPQGPTRPFVAPNSAEKLNLSETSGFSTGNRRLLECG
ncbi:hypothetical protein Y032_0029g1880 [Ancylostoma ceylanicum]|uniref:VWFA domain-containing protein n=1 Tax=Ancylostoma ceylanicum TaxID=53326 RepID=A0A016UTI7_9BILA|nr:hypothetical protein Y032_0029g1880 [Ancylostoma ceylanicum]